MPGETTTSGAIKAVSEDITFSFYMPDSASELLDFTIRKILSWL